MVRVEDSQGGVIAQYYYDPFGRRLWKDVGATRTCFFYTDEGLAGEFSAAGTQIRAFGYKPDSVWSTDPLFMTQAGTWFYFHNDRSGTPQSLVMANGFEVWSADYQAFGQAQVNAAGGITVNLRYPGQYYDAETGLHYNWHRYYNPQTGRYLTTDPIGLAGGINLYVYVSGNPIGYIDPLGLLDAISAYDYWSQAGANGAARAINGGIWDAITGNSKAAGAAAMAAFIDFFAARTLQENASKSGFASAKEGCEDEALKYGAFVAGQLALEAFGGEILSRLGRVLGKPLYRFAGAAKGAASKSGLEATKVTEKGIARIERYLNDSTFGIRIH